MKIKLLFLTIVFSLFQQMAYSAGESEEFLKRWTSDLKSQVARNPVNRSEKQPYCAQKKTQFVTQCEEQWKARHSKLGQAVKKSPCVTLGATASQNCNGIIDAQPKSSVCDGKNERECSGNELCKTRDVLKDGLSSEDFNQGRPPTAQHYTKKCVPKECSEFNMQAVCIRVSDCKWMPEALTKAGKIAAYCRKK